MAENTRDQIQLSFGRQIDWETLNPILLSGELVCIYDNDTLEPIDLKFGNGVARFNQLPSLVNNGKVYTKSETDELLKVISDAIKVLTEKSGEHSDNLEELQTITIPGITKLIDSKASETNKLLSESSVIAAIKEIVNGRIGRKLTFTVEGEKFPDTTALLAGPWFIDGEEIVQPILNDQAEIEGLDYSLRFTGTKWEPNTTKLLLTDAQTAALNSGVTARDVETIHSLDEDNIANKQLLEEHQEAINTTSHNLEELTHSAVVKVDGWYSHTVRIISGGANYSLFNRCTVNNAEGYITKTDKGSIAEIILFDSRRDLTTEESIEIVSEGGVGATCVITSIAKVYSLSEEDAHIKRLLTAVSKESLPRGLDNNTLQMVRNGALTPVFVSSTARYVDGSYTGNEEGIEIAPFKTGTAALKSLKYEDEATIVYAAGNYSEILEIASTTKKSFSGYAIGSRASTVLKRLIILRTAEQIGLRDLRIAEAFEVNEAKAIYADNITVDGSSSIGAGDAAYFTHCTFNGRVTVTKGVVEFDCCAFSDTSTLAVENGATVIMRGCVNATPVISTGGTYIQLSGSIAPILNQTVALTASTGATFVGLFNGVAMTSTDKLATDRVADYAPISIMPGVKCALGSFLFDVDKSTLNGIVRISCDGLSSSQILVAPREGAEEGYKTASTYLPAHLDAISQAIKTLASKTIDNAIDKVEMAAGPTPGTLVLKGTLQGVTVYETEPIAVSGLGTAAFTDVELYATAEQGEHAEEAYAKFANGISEEDLSAALQTKLASLASAEDSEKIINKTKTLTDASTDTEYPTAKAVYLSAVRPLASVLPRIPEVSSSNPADDILVSALTVRQLIANNTGRFLVPNRQTFGDSRDLFADFDAIETAETYYSAGSPISRSNLLSGDRANYFKTQDDGSSIQAQAIYNGKFWQFYADMGTVFTEEQIAAYNSGITKAIVDKLHQPAASGETVASKSILSLEKTVAEEIKDRQHNLPADPRGSLVTNSGELGKFGAYRAVVDTITNKDLVIGTNVSYLEQETNEAGEPVTDEGGAPVYKEGRRSTDIPEARAVLGLINKFSARVKAELNKKEDTLPKLVGTDTRGWYHYSALGTIECLDYASAKEKLKDTLGSDYYLRVQDAPKSYIPYTASETQKILGSPTTDEDSNLVPRYFEPVSEVEPTDASKTFTDLDIPTVPAVKKLAERLRTADTQNFNSLNASKQVKLDAKLNDATDAPHELVSRTNEKGVTDTVYVDKSLRDSGGKLSESTSSVPDSNAVATEIKNLENADANLEGRTFHSLPTDVDISENLPVYGLDETTQKYFLKNSGIPMNAMLKTITYQDATLKALQSFAFYTPASTVQNTNNVVTIDNGGEGISVQNSVLSNVTFISPKIDGYHTTASDLTPQIVWGRALDLAESAKDTTFINSTISLNLKRNTEYNLTFINSFVVIFVPDGISATRNLHFINSEAIIFAQSNNGSAVPQSVNLQLTSSRATLYRNIDANLTTYPSFNSSIIVNGLAVVSHTGSSNSASLTIDLSESSKASTLYSNLKDKFYVRYKANSNYNVTNVTDTIAGRKITDIFTADVNGVKSNKVRNAAQADNAAAADKLNSNAGSTTKPIYFKNGVPVQCDDTLGNNISGNAATATKLASDTQVGDIDKPIYFKNGVPVASTKTLGSGIKSIYLSGGQFKESTETKGSGVKLIYLSSGSITESSSGVGAANKPVYLSNGTITVCSSTVGSSTRPVFMSGGTITQCGTSLAVSITGNAATATTIDDGDIA